jgi:hypothetical protein
MKWFEGIMLLFMDIQKLKPSTITWYAIAVTVYEELNRPMYPIPPRNERSPISSLSRT